MKPVVSHIEWLSEVAQEALLTVSDGVLLLRVFCQPCHLHEGDLLVQPLLAFDAEEIMVSSQAVPSARVLREPWGQECCGVVEDIKAKLIRVGEFRITLDVPLPGDIVVGQAICFKCARLDCLD